MSYVFKCYYMGISIHAPIVGCDIHFFLPPMLFIKFQSTHPSWGATIFKEWQQRKQSISIHAPIVGCDPEDALQYDVMLISIHAPIVGCDTGWKSERSARPISIHAPIVGCDPSIRSTVFSSTLFQSTHPSWGATGDTHIVDSDNGNFNPRTHRGVRLKKFLRHIYKFYYFNPRTHRGVRRGLPSPSPQYPQISIHAPIVGCDNPFFVPFWCQKDFNPRTHRGVRLYFLQAHNASIVISIHAPIVGCDVVFHLHLLSIHRFQSTHPSWGATIPVGEGYKKGLISIHAPIVGCDKSTI